MIRAIVKLQEANTIPGRFAFIGGGRNCHGIMKGAIKFVEVQASSWAKIRREIKEYKKGVMGAYNVGAQTVESWCKFEPSEPAQCFPRVREVKPGHEFYWASLNRSSEL